MGRYTNVNKHLAKARGSASRPAADGGRACPPALFLSRCRHWPRTLEPGAGAAVRQLRIELGLLSPAEGLELANALLRSAWSAVLGETRIVLLDLLIDIDDTILQAFAE
jgi:hypothetical protein